MQKLKILFIDANQGINRQMVDLSGVASQYDFFYKTVGLDIDRTLREIGRINPHVIIVGGDTGSRHIRGFDFVRHLQRASCSCVLVENTSTRSDSFKEHCVDLEYNIQGVPDMLGAVIRIIAPAGLVPAVTLH